MSERFEEREQIAQAADKVAESFMERYRQRPIGDGERFYDLSDAFSSFAHHLRHVEGCTCGWGGTHDPDNPRCAANAPGTAEPEGQEWALRAADGTQTYTSRDVAEKIAGGETGWTLSGSPVVAALTRSKGSLEWSELPRLRPTPTGGDPA